MQLLTADHINMKSLFIHSLKNKKNTKIEVKEFFGLLTELTFLEELHVQLCGIELNDFTNICISKGETLWPRMQKLTIEFNSEWRVDGTDFFKFIMLNQQIMP